MRTDACQPTFVRPPTLTHIDSFVLPSSVWFFDVFSPNFVWLFYFQIFQCNELHKRWMMRMWNHQTEIKGSSFFNYKNFSCGVCRNSPSDFACRKCENFRFDWNEKEEKICKYSREWDISHVRNIYELEHDCCILRMVWYTFENIFYSHINCSTSDVFFCKNFFVPCLALFKFKLLFSVIRFLSVQQIIAEFQNLNNSN